MTLILGKILGSYLIVTGLGFLLSSDFYTRMIENADKSDPVLINLSGMVHFLIGVAIVTNHWLWHSVLAGIVSALGISFLLKGAFLIALPSLALRTNRASPLKLRLMSAGFIAAGGFIAYLSFRA